MEKIQELKTLLADSRGTLADLDGEIKTMKARQSAIAERIASVAADLVTAKTAAQEAAKEFALGSGAEDEIVQAQSAAMRLEASRTAFESAEAAIKEELTKLDEPRRVASERVARLTDMIYSHIANLELKKAEVFIKRAHRAFCKQKAAYMHRDSFNRDVANLVHHCRHDDSDKISRELSTIYGLDL